jgi:hypothetical protein
MMNLPIATTRIVTIAALTLTIAAAGCRQASAPTANRPSDKDTSESGREIVKGKSPSDLQVQAMLAAKDALFAKLSGRLMEAMVNQGPAAAISVCQKEAPQIAAEVSDEHKLRIGRTGVRLRNPINQPPGWAKPLTDKKTDTAQFVVLNDDDVAALLPIKLQVQCLMCHGPKEQVAPVIQDQLAKLYPNDQATGFHAGDLRGWFWIEMPGD